MRVLELVPYKSRFEFSRRILNIIIFVGLASQESSVMISSNSVEQCINKKLCTSSPPIVLSEYIMPSSVVSGHFRYVLRDLEAYARSRMPTSLKTAGSMPPTVFFVEHENLGCIRFMRKIKIICAITARHTWK